MSASTESKKCEFYACEIDCEKGFKYIDITERNPYSRFDEHKNGQAGVFTKNLKVVSLRRFEVVQTLDDLDAFVESVRKTVSHPSLVVVASTPSGLKPYTSSSTPTASWMDHLTWNYWFKPSSPPVKKQD